MNESKEDKRDKSEGMKRKRDKDDEWEGEHEGDAFERRKRGREGDVFETTCSPRHDSDKMTSQET